jgi:hypothetical protein
MSEENLRELCLFNTNRFSLVVKGFGVFCSGVGFAEGGFGDEGGVGGFGVGFGSEGGFEGVFDPTV